MLKKISTQQNEIIAKQQVDLLPQFCTNPNELVGKSIKHKTCEDDGNVTVVEWFRSKVIGIHDIEQNVFKTEFHVKYDDFSDDDWHFPLLQDMKNGDLIIINVMKKI